jgi:hypothetical protein
MHGEARCWLQGLFKSKICGQWLRPQAPKQVLLLDFFPKQCRYVVPCLYHYVCESVPIIILKRLQSWPLTSTCISNFWTIMNNKHYHWEVESILDVWGGFLDVWGAFGCVRCIFGCVRFGRPFEFHISSKYLYQFVRSDDMLGLLPCSNAQSSGQDIYAAHSSFNKAQCCFCPLCYSGLCVKFFLTFKSNIYVRIRVAYSKFIIFMVCCPAGWEEAAKLSKL